MSNPPEYTTVLPARHPLCSGQVAEASARDCAFGHSRAYSWAFASPTTLYGRRTLIMRTCFGIGLALSCLHTTGAATYVVSPDGNDDSDGSTAAPFRTIGRAAGAMAAGNASKRSKARSN